MLSLLWETNHCLGLAGFWVSQSREISSVAECFNFCNSSYLCGASSQETKSKQCGVIYLYPRNMWFLGPTNSVVSLIDVIEETRDLSLYVIADCALHWYSHLADDLISLHLSSVLKGLNDTDGNTQWSNQTKTCIKRYQSISLNYSINPHYILY